MDPISIAAAGASLVGGFLSSSGQSDANKANLKIAREQMKFQERMSNTAHQREVADLRAAGLNPLLSANGGASTPSGASANMVNTKAPLANSIAKSPEAILAVQQQRADISKTKAETAVADNTASNLLEQNKNLGMQNVVLQRQAEKLLVDMGYTRRQAEKVLAETGLIGLNSKAQGIKNLSDLFNLASDLRGGIAASDTGVTRTIKQAYRLVSGRERVLHNSGSSSEDLDKLINQRLIELLQQ